MTKRRSGSPVRGRQPRAHRSQSRFERWPSLIYPLSCRAAQLEHVPTSSCPTLGAPGPHFDQNLNRQALSGIVDKDARQLKRALSSTYSQMQVECRRWRPRRSTDPALELLFWVLQIGDTPHNCFPCITRKGARQGEQRSVPRACSILLHVTWLRKRDTAAAAGDRTLSESPWVPVCSSSSAGSWPSFHLLLPQIRASGLRSCQIRPAGNRNPRWDFVQQSVLFWRRAE